MQIIIGGPGTGKTTRLLQIIEQHLREGMAPSRIAFVSFTKKAIGEAVERACTEFNFSSDDLPYFRTIHSLAYRELGLSRTMVMGRSDWKVLSELTGFNLSIMTDPEEGPPIGPISDGGKILSIDSYAKARRISLEDSWHENGEGVGWYELKYVLDTIDAYKRETGKVDFSDMLEQYLMINTPLPTDVVIVDEAQDLSTIQWDIIDMITAHSEKVYVAGDDDQAIYRWSGADVNRFVSMSGEVEVLPVSHRLPAQIFDQGHDIAKQIGTRREKDWKAASHDGSVDWITSPEHLDLSSGTWMLLARNLFFLQAFKIEAVFQGVAFTTAKGSSVDHDHVRAILSWEKLRKGEPVEAEEARHLGLYIDLPEIPEKDWYTAGDLELDMDPIWHDALTGIDIEKREYYLTILRNGEKLTVPPRVHIGTIHSVKGGEADNVAIMTDMTNRSYEGYQLSPDDEHRVFYVGATRAKHKLIWITPQSTKFYSV